jgi:hypothetical protein
MPPNETRHLDLEQKICFICNLGIVSERRCGNSVCWTTFRVVHDLKVLLNPFYYSGMPFPVNPNPLCKAVVHIDVPESLSSPKHFGHLTWTVCEFMDSLDGTK